MKRTLTVLIVLTAVATMASDTNSVPAGAFDAIPGLNLLPAKWQGLALALVAILPMLGRGYHAVSNGGGLKGLVGALIFGTNTPKPASNPEPPKS